MSLDVRQVRDFIVRPVLEYLKLPGGLAAEKLVMGTAAQESQFAHVDQLEAAGRPVKVGPALGLWQMERATHDDLVRRFLGASSRDELRVKVQSLAIPHSWALHETAFEQLAGNLYYGAALCRVLYFSRPGSFLDGMSIEALAGMWKRYYNTPAGDGTPEQWLANWDRFCAPLYP